MPSQVINRRMKYVSFLASDKFLSSDVALVTSLRDGMNLVSYEFVACQEAKKGVLILSEVRILHYAELNKCVFPSKLFISLHLLYSLQELHSHWVLELFL